MAAHINIMDRFEFLANMKIAYKFMVIAAIIAAGFAVVAYTFQAQQDNQERATILNAEANHFSELTNNIENRTQNARRIEKEFLLSNNPRYIDNIERLITTLLETSVAELTALTRDENLLEIINDLGTTLKDYRTAFRNMANARERMGLDHNSGLHGKLRKAVHEVEETLKRHEQIELSHSMLMMRRHEKDYLARKLDKYIKKMAVEQERFAGLLEKSGLSATDRSEVTDRMKEYHQTFLQLPQLHSEITSRVSQMNDTIAMIDLHLLDLIEARDELLAKQQYLVVATTARLIRNFYIVIGCVVTAVILLMFLVTRAISRSVKTASAVAGAIAQGKLDNDFDISSGDETGQLLMSLQTMQDNLRATIEAERRTAGENRRIREALDNVDANVMIVDTDYQILYINDALTEMMRIAENDIRKDVPEFNAGSLKGAGIAMFYKDAATMHRELDALAESDSSELILGGRTMDVVINPIVNSSGDHLGTVLEWTDRTQEVHVEDEIQDMVDKALEGNLGTRIELAGKAGFFESLSGGFNALVDVNERIINDTSRVMGAIARGDLTNTIKVKYDGCFGQLRNDVNQSVEKLTGVMSNIRTAADSVLHGSQEIAAGNSDLAHRTREQDARLEETAASMEEMTSTVRQNADNARQADQLASGAREQAEKGGEVVNNAVTAMGEITRASKQIADIIGVIDEIAFQTNLLALNAAVEAARAGEQGRGFAVVASEVRNLAGRSATAAREIKDLIKDSVGKVEEGSRLVDESGHTLEEIVTSVQQVSDIIAEIAAASEEQSAGITQVNEAIAQLDEMTQQNAALVDEAAAASKSMGEQAHDLNKQVSFFTIADTTDATEKQGDLTERRSGDRPWSDAGNSNATPVASSAAEPQPPRAAAGGADQDSEWEEF